MWGRENLSFPRCHSYILELFGWFRELVYDVVLALFHMEIFD